MNYVGRFAPSPSGPLHAGSIVAALASWLDARAHNGRWLLRIEDIDTPRCDPKHTQRILECLHALGLEWDGELVVQSRRLSRYSEVLQQLQQNKQVFACGCSRKDLSAHIGTSGEIRYPGTCRHGLAGGKTARTWRFEVDSTAQSFQDRLLGLQQQHPAQECGDFVLRRADGLFAYQLVVVVDDADQGVNHIVRGEDLLSSTGRQLQLQKALGIAPPSYLHIPLLLNAQGQKLSKQSGALEVDWQQPADCLNKALASLGQATHDGNVQQVLMAAVKHWNITKITAPGT